MVSTFTYHTIVRTERMRICEICIQKEKGKKKKKFCVSVNERLSVSSVIYKALYLAVN